MANQWPTPDQIARKRQNGETLTAWETSVYRLNFRDNGDRYSSDPKKREAQYAADNATTAAAALGRIGGKAKTAAKADAARANGAKGGRPKKVRQPSATPAAAK